MEQALPTLVRVEDFAKSWGLSVHQGYDALKRLPAGVKVSLGRRIRIDAAKLAAWMDAGGSFGH